MAILVSDPTLEERLLRERESSGADRYDEVWEGTYVMPPMPNDEHQYLVTRFVYILEDLIGVSGSGHVRPGINLSGRTNNWEQDYRVPDVAVFLEDGGAINHGTHWQGPADFLIEIASPDDQTRDKIPYYGRLSVRELLIVDRDPRSLELYAQVGGALALTGRSEPGDGIVLSSSRVDLTFELADPTPRPRILVRHSKSDREWSL